MRSNRASAAALALVAVVASCGRPAPPARPEASVAADSAACRVGPDGGPQVADRGIGGTGAPVLEADRGIGGTGGPQLADRGIGGTGIVGVITGFASVCLAGQEVALPAGVPVSIDSHPATAGALRAGQVAVIEASQESTGLRARRIVVRYEVSGPVEAVGADRLRVAGQDVALLPQTWGPRPSVGDWVAVSGLRRADGTIEATRLDPRPPGAVLVRGRLNDDGGTLRIGALPVRPAPGLAEAVGQEVTLTGSIVAGALVANSVAPDLLAADPAAFFGPQVGVVLLEGFAALEGGRLRLGEGFSADAPGLRLNGSRRGVVRLERGDGGLRAIGLSERPAFAPIAPTRQFEPAPVPNRAVGGGPDARRGPSGTPAGRTGRGRDQRDGFGPGGRDDLGPSGFPRPDDALGGGGPSGFGPPRGR